MKKITFLIITSLLLFCKGYGQTVIENPTYGYSNVFILNIKKIELTDTSTNMYCRVVSDVGSWINIPDKTYIQPVKGGEKLFIRSIEGIPMNEQYIMPQSGEVSYKLIFPKIGNHVKGINYGEDTKDGWLIRDIQVRPDAHPSLIEELTGNWFNLENGSWVLSVFDSVAVYKNQVWNCDVGKLKNGVSSLKLKNTTKTIELFVRNDKDGIYSLGDSPESLSSCTNDLSKLTFVNPVNEKPYQSPIFKADSAIYSGYIKDYSLSTGVKTMNLHIDDILTGQQNTFLIKISVNGYFSVKVPLYYAHYGFVRSPLYNGAVFLEPGKALFQMIGQPDNNEEPLFMGESARINTDLLKIENIHSHNYFEINKLVLNMTPAQYKSYCQEMQQKDFKILDSMAKTHRIGARAYQIKKLELDYLNMAYMMEYSWRFSDAYREKNNIPRDQRTLPVKIDSLAGGYFNFITNEKTNDPLAVLSTSYGTFINRIKLLDIMRDKPKTYLTLDIAEELQKSGYIFTPSENKLMEVLKTMNSPEVKAVRNEFLKKYGKQGDEFSYKYRDTIQLMYKQITEVVTASVIEKYFSEKGILLTKGEKEYLKGLNKYEQSPVTINLKQISEVYGDSISLFHMKHNAFINGLFANNARIARIEKMQKIFGVQEGLATDIMTAQDKCRKIVAEMKPLSDDEIKSIQKYILTPFIADYIVLCNEQMKGKVEGNKSN